MEFLREQGTTLVEWLRSVPEESSERSYAEGKWTAKQALGHLSDTERVMAYRALCFRARRHHSPPRVRPGCVCGKRAVCQTEVE